MTETPDEIREAALRAVKWLKISRAKAAPDAYNTILYLAAREHVLEERLTLIARAALGADLPTDSVTLDPGPTDDPSGPQIATQGLPEGS